ncbi:hypothetical protein GQ457_13G020660 [Hibiscus cannabinus]
MKLKGILNNKEVLILVDSGSTHNFVDKDIVKDLKLPVQFIPPFGVQIGNGDVIRCNRICRDIELQLPGLEVNQNYFPFKIGGANLVLGIQWLASLNIVQANWNEMFLIFELDGKKFKLQMERFRSLSMFSSRSSKVRYYDRLTCTDVYDGFDRWYLRVVHGHTGYVEDAPMFKRLDAKIRGRAVAMRAKAQAAGRGTTAGRGAVPSIRRKEKKIKHSLGKRKGKITISGKEKRKIIRLASVLVYFVLGFGLQQKSCWVSFCSITILRCTVLAVYTCKFPCRSLLMENNHHS